MWHVLNQNASVDLWSRRSPRGCHRNIIACCHIGAAFMKSRENRSSCLSLAVNAHECRGSAWAIPSQLCLPLPTALPSWAGAHDTLVACGVIWLGCCTGLTTA